jgi:hypothetical protein
MNIRYRVELCPAERDHLIGMLSAAKRAARRGQGADLLETRGWDDLASGVIEASYS